MKHPRTIAAVALLLAACSDNPVAPPMEVTRMTPSAARFSASGESAASELTPTIADVRERLIPLVQDAAASERLGSLMAQTQLLVDQGDLAEAHRLLLEAQSVVNPNGDGTSADLGDPADIAVLRLTLENLSAATRF
jgi:hypothetical protein